MELYFYLEASTKFTQFANIIAFTQKESTTT